MMDAMSIYDMMSCTRQIRTLYLGNLGCYIRSTSVLVLDKCFLNIGYNASVPPIKSPAQ